MKRTIELLAATAVLSTASACDRISVTDTDNRGYAEITLDVSVSAVSRSAFNPDTDSVNDLAIYAFREDGSLAECISGHATDKYSMLMETGTYNLYVLANTGGGEAHKTEDSIKELTIDMSDLGKGVPMCWHGTVNISSHMKHDISVTLEKLVSTVWFSVDLDLVEGLEITSARLHQGAGLVRPFMQGGSRALREEEMIDGDYATDEDLRLLMTGDRICFHVPENCQGVLLPENDDPWAKVPDSIGKSARLCTYIEMKGRWKEDACYSGDIIYRFYLGEDAATDFNVRRNTIHILRLCPDEDNFGRISWKIDASQMELVKWDATADLSRNFHDKENFHVTEIIRADITLDKRGQKYWKERGYRFGLVGIGKDGGEMIRFESPEDDGDGAFHALGTCMKKGEFNLMMYDSATGEMFDLPDSGRILTPVLVSGPEMTYEDRKVIGYSEVRNIIINRNEIETCYYLTDSQGYNLNRKDWYGCNLQICRWETETFGSIPGASTTTRLVYGNTGNGGYAIKCITGVSNDGYDTEKNMELSACLGTSGNGIRICELVSGSNTETGLKVLCEDISVTVMPVTDEAKAIFDTEFMYVLHNSSNLPVSIQGLRLNSMNSIPSGNGMKPIIGWDPKGCTSDEPLVISKMPSTLCSLCPEGAANLGMDGDVCFAADGDGVFQKDLPKEQHCMFLVVEAGLAYTHTWSPEITGHIDLTSRDSSYGEDGSSSCGMYFYSGDSLQDRSSRTAGQTDFSSYGSIVARSSIRKLNEMAEIDMKMDEDNEITARASKQADVDVEISGTLYGHIRCITIEDPLGIVWGHYFKDEFDFRHNGRHRLTASFGTIDDSCIAEALTAMRNEKYYSALDLSEVSQFRNPPYPGQYGTIREYLKPYALTMDIQISSSDDEPLAVSWEGQMEYDYTVSEPVTWPKGLLGTITIVPSSYSGYDSKVDEDGCPAGNTFAAEKVTLDPGVEFITTPAILLKSSSTPLP